MKLYLAKRKVNLFNILIFIIGLAIVMCRIINLDADVPSWGVSQYAPMDEGQYVQMAINKMEYNSINVEFDYPELENITSAHMRNDIVANVLTYCTFKIFGDNYYGLRMSSVICALIVYILFFMCLNNVTCSGNATTQKIEKVIILFLFIFNYSFSLMERIVEPSIYRQVFLLLVLLLYLLEDKYENNKLFPILIGFFSAFSVVFVYITNIYLLLAVYILEICLVFRRKKFVRLLFVMLGSASTLLIGELYYMYFWDETILGNTFDIIHGFSAVPGYVSKENGLLIGAITNIFEIVSSNIFLYSLPLLAVLLLLVPSIIKIIREEWRKQSMGMMFSALSLILFVGQTIINNDFVLRKSVIIYPLLLIILLKCLYELNDGGRMYTLLNFTGNDFVRYLYESVVLLVVVGVIAYRMYLNTDGSIYDYKVYDKIVLIMQLVFVILEFIIINNVNKKSIRDIFAPIIVSTMMVGIMFNMKYIYFSPTYTEKDIMIQMGNEANEQMLYGAFSYSFTLYNSVKPVSNTFDLMNEKMNNEKTGFYIDYGKIESIPEVIRSDSNLYFLELRGLYQRNYTAFGGHNQIGLFKIQDKNVQ